MARFNEILVGRFARSLQKVFGIKGTVPVPSLASEIFPVHNLKAGSEMRYLESWQRFGVSFLLTAGGAGNISIGQIRNPVNSNVVAVLEKLDIISTATQVNVSGPSPVSTDFGTVFTPSRFDARGIQGNTCPVTGKNNSVATFVGNTIWILGANVPITAPATEVLTYEEQEIALLPGDALQITSITANTALGPISLWWRERFLEDSERT